MSDKAFEEWNSCRPLFKNLQHGFEQAWHASGEYHTKKAVKEVIDFIKDKNCYCSDCGNYNKTTVGAEIRKRFEVKDDM